MALCHRDLPVYGVQFHPESVGTDRGKRILVNFLELARERAASHPERSEGGVPRVMSPSLRSR